MRFLALLLSLAAFGQELPVMTVGVGPSWTRGDVHAVSADVDVAIRLGNSQAFSWSTISTPVAKVPYGSPPLSSAITTGIAYRVANSASGAVSLLIIAQGGMNSAQPQGAPSLAVTGSVGLPVRIRKSNFYVMPYTRASKPSRGTDGALLSTVLQFGAMVIYGFGSK